MADFELIEESELAIDIEKTARAIYKSLSSSEASIKYRGLEPDLLPLITHILALVYYGYGIVHFDIIKKFGELLKKIDEKILDNPKDLNGINIITPSQKKSANLESIKKALNNGISEVYKKNGVDVNKELIEYIVDYVIDSYYNEPTGITSQNNLSSLKSNNGDHSDTTRINYSERVNYALCHSGCDNVIRSIFVPHGMNAQIRIAADFSKIWCLDGGVHNEISPILNAELIAKLSAPLQTQLLIKYGDKTERAYPVTVTPLRALNLNKKYAKAVATFVLENDPVVSDIVHEAKANPTPNGMQLSIKETAELLYDYILNTLKLGYLYEREIFTNEQGEIFCEQGVRFPSQMICDRGGTCIDFALLYAATLYRAGLSPMIFTLGNEYGYRHALVGIWMKKVMTNEVVSGPQIYDKQASHKTAMVNTLNTLQGANSSEILFSLKLHA